MGKMFSIADNIKLVRENIEKAAQGREIYLVGASKTKDAAAVRQAAAAGIDAVGENRVQELLEKRAQGAYEGLPVHFIGKLQKNKVRQVAGQVELIQSVDSVELMELISRHAQRLGRVQDILIEINIGREDSKSGFMPEHAELALRAAADLQGVRLIGLMTIPPAMKQTVGKYISFDEMYKLFVDIRAKKYDNTDMRYLSMGMSGDYTQAIRSGANMVRVGSAIFGER